MLDEATLERQQRLSTTLLHSSQEVGWEATLVEHRRCSERFREFEREPTRDLTLVLQLDGLLELQSLSRGRWTCASFAAGALGMSAPGDGARFRTSCAAAFHQAHVFVPGAVLTEAADALARAGTRSAVGSLRRLRFRDAVMTETIRTLLEAARSGLPNLYAEQAMAWLATHLLTTHGSADPDTRVGWNAGEDRRFTRALALIHDSYALPLSLGALAAEAGISKFHFARRFREQTGRPPYRYLEEKRMAEARRLLLETDLPVSEVGRRCGYPRSAQFTIVFRRHHPQAPGAYRRRRDGTCAAPV